MPLHQDFRLGLGTDGSLRINLQPPSPLSGKTCHFQMTHRPGGTSGTLSGYVVGLVDKWLASGFNGVSGITLVDGAAGVVLVNLYRQDTSGLSPGSYFYTHKIEQSGGWTPTTDGFCLLV